MKETIDTKVLDLKKDYIANSYIDKAISILVNVSEEHFNYFTENMTPEEILLFNIKVKELSKLSLKNKDIKEEIYKKCLTNEFPNIWIYDFSEFPDTSKLTTHYWKTSKSMSLKYKEKLKKFDFLQLYKMAYKQSLYCEKSYQLREKYSIILNQSQSTSLIQVSKNQTKGDSKAHLINLINSYGSDDYNIKKMAIIIEKIKKYNLEFGIILQYEFNQISKEALATYFPPIEKNYKMYRNMNLTYQYLARNYSHVILTFEILFQDFLKKEKLDLDFETDQLFK